jgi:hypothetical protein
MLLPGQWITYGCVDWGPRLFHPDDFHLKDRMLDCGSVCFFEAIDGDFWVLRFGSLRVRLREGLIGAGSLPTPAFDFEELVRVGEHRTVRIGRIRRINWHGKRRVHLFWIESNGKRVKNRYFTEELERI